MVAATVVTSRDGSMSGVAWVQDQVVRGFVILAELAQSPRPMSRC